MSADDNHITLLPATAHGESAGLSEPVFAWWKSVAGRIVQHGKASDVLAAAGYTQEERPAVAILLLSASDCAVRMHSMSGMTIPQALAAARIEALDAAIDDNADLHATTALQSTDEEAVHCFSTVVRKQTLSDHLAAVQTIGIQPNHIFPATLLLDPQGEGYCRFKLADQTYLRGPELAAADDPALRQALLINDDPPMLDDDAVRDALARLPDETLPDLRSGEFARRSERILLSEPQKRILVGMLTALVVITLLIPALRIWRYNSAEDAVTSAVLEKVQADFPNATDLVTAQTQVDAELARRGAGAGVFSAAGAALLSAMQSAPSVTMRDLRYQPDGTVSAVLTAPDNQAMNLVLRNLQTEQGYTITVADRQEPGRATIDLTVRG